MDWLQVVSNIFQIIGVVWLLFFGGRAAIEVIRDVLKKRPIKWPSPLTITNVLLALILLSILSLRIFPIPNSTPAPAKNTASTSPTPVVPQPTSTPHTNSSPTPQVSPTSSVEYSYLVSPPLPLRIPCQTNCMSHLEVILTRAIFDKFANNLVLTFSLTNIDSSLCEMTVDTLDIHDIHEKVYSGQGQIFLIPPLGAKQDIVTDATFSLVPVRYSPYKLYLTLSCQANVPLVYQTEALVFYTYYRPVPQPQPTLVNQIINSVITYIRSPIGILTILVLTILIASVLIRFRLLWLDEPQPFGLLELRGRWITLGKQRSLIRRLFKKSRISSKELKHFTGFETYGDDFELIFKGNHRVFIKLKSRYSKITIERDGKIFDFSSAKQGEIELRNDDEIKSRTRTIAIFKTSKEEDEM